jgi:delta1-piperideine-2-carboxylate reductase
MSTTELTLDEIHTLARTALEVAGSSDEMADAVADTVMRAERDGSLSHGLFRIPGYVASLRSGKVNGNADPKVETVTPVMIRCDGDNGYAPLVHARCLGTLAAAAREYGIAMLSIVRSHHFALYGSNPVSFAWPRPGKTPVVFDMATAAMAMGDIQIAARDGHDVQLGTGLNKAGEMTADPKEILEGMLLPFGGYKGSHISMMVELLAGPLVGETASFETAKTDNQDGGPPAGGQFILAMSPDITSGSTNWAGAANAFFDKLKSLGDDVRLPGERRHKNRLNTGPRSVNTELVDKIRELAGLAKR